MDKAKAAGRNMSLRHIRATNSDKSVRKAKTENKEGTFRRRSPH